MSRLPDLNKCLGLDRVGVATLRLGILEQVENASGVAIRFPAGLAGSVILKPAWMIGLDNEDGIMPQAWFLGMYVRMKLFAREDLRTQRANTIGK